MISQPYNKLQDDSEASLYRQQRRFVSDGGGLVMIFMTQLIPSSYPVRQEFRAIVNGALV